jgi:hypothetical protein
VGRKSGLDLLLPNYPSEIFFGQLEEAFQLPHTVIAYVTCSPRCAGLFQKPDGFLMVRLGDVEGMFKGGLVESVVIHGTSVVPIPG